ncbi:MAG TPA: UDPGP type 1 family protein, partial [Planctomycetes bacterium]|nr:UDPGP type 1 family protein [Planctomycetota bacterium]
MEDIAARKERLNALHQEHLLAFADGLNERERAAFFAQLDAADIETVLHLFRDLVCGGHKGEAVPAVEELAPPPYIKYPRAKEEWRAWQEAERAGVSALKNGEVACLMVAGGQGSRLGFSGPKGAFPIGPLTRRSLFHLQAEKVLAASRRCGRAVPFLIMVSETNEEDSRGFFVEHDYFGLEPEDIFFFKQENIPAVDAHGRILLEEKGRLFTAPNGHGGCIKALLASGALDMLEERGVKYVSYFQVDNPLVRAVDPCFIGFHAMHGA